MYNIYLEEKRQNEIEKKRKEEEKYKKYKEKYKSKVYKFIIIIIFRNITNNVSKL